MRINVPTVLQRVTTGFTSFLLVLSMVSGAMPFFVSEVASAAPIDESLTSLTSNSTYDNQSMPENTDQVSDETPVLENAKQVQVEPNSATMIIPFMLLPTPTPNTICSNPTCQYLTVADAVASAPAGTTLLLKEDQVVPAEVAFNRAITFDGEGHTLSVNGGGHRFSLEAAVTLKNLNITKTDDTAQNIVYIHASSVVIDHVNFMGMYVNSASATTRGLEISADDFMVKDSSFTKLRQPAYINGFKGTLERNTVSTSRGWVVVGNSNVTFTGNMWSNNVPNDIAIIDDDNNATTLAVNNYPCSVVNTIKANNNNAVIDNQLLGRTCAATPVVSTVLVTPDDTKGWTQSDTRTNGKVDYVTDSSSPFPVGALSLKTDVSPVSGQDKAQYYVYPYVSSTFYLSDVSGSLGYSTKQNSASFSAGLPAYQIAVYLQNASNADTFATLTYEPYVDKGNGAVQNGQWQNWAIDRSSSKFYVSKNVVNANGSVTASQGSSTYTLDQINAIFPNAKVIGYGANVGSNNPGYDTEVDGFTFNNTTYDFDPTPVSVTPGSGGAGGGNTGSGSSTGGQGLTTTLGAISPLVATANNPSDLASSTVGALGVTTPTATDKDGDEETLGAQTKKAAKTPVVEATNNGWNIMGLAWYWWVLILAALAAIWWFLVARRRNADEN